MNFVWDIGLQLETQNNNYRQHINWFQTVVLWTQYKQFR
jgi:hypothetical protein